MSHANGTIVGLFEYRPEKLSKTSHSRIAALTGLEMCAELTLGALEDAGLQVSDLDGISIGALFGISEATSAVPITVADYLGVNASFGDSVDLHGATPVGMVGRAALAIARGLAKVIICLAPGGAWRPDGHEAESTRRFGASSYRAGSPQAEFEIPFGHLGQNAIYAMITQRYAHQFGYEPALVAKLVSQQRYNACATPDAIFHTQPITPADVLASKLIATPLRKLEIVMPCLGGAAVVLAAPDIARRCRHRPVTVTGYGEGLAYKSPHFAPDITEPSIGDAARRAFAMAGLTPADIDVAQLYDCYPITTLLALEGAGFCPRGQGFRFLEAHDFRWHGDFPLNTNGGQLGFGQAGLAGGLCHVTEAVRQISHRADGRQVMHCDHAFVTGNGSVMSEQNALILRGE